MYGDVDRTVLTCRSSESLSYLAFTDAVYECLWSSAGTCRWAIWLCFSFSSAKVHVDHVKHMSDCDGSR